MLIFKYNISISPLMNPGKNHSKMGFLTTFKPMSSFSGLQQRNAAETCSFFYFNLAAPQFGTITSAEITFWPLDGALNSQLCVAVGFIQ